MFGTTTYELSLTRNYVSRWGMAQAVRELIQNALDSESPFVYEFARDEQANTLRLTSEFATLSPQTLLLGATSKAESRDCIGSFGEGYKIALLVLTRMGYDVEVHNGDLLWRPRFRHHKRFNEELLVVDEGPLPDRANKGLTFVVHGLADADVDEIRASCLQMQANLGQQHTTRYGEIMLERPGRLYVGGLFVCETELSYGYNIKPEFLRLERDRQTVDSWDLKSMTRDMWYDTGRLDEVAKMIDEEVPDLEYARYSSTPMVREACFQLFSSRHPHGIVATSQQELKDKVTQGLTEVVYVPANMGEVVRASQSYQQRPSASVRIATPADRLEAWYAKAKFHMHDSVKKSFRALVDESRSWSNK